MRRAEKRNDEKLHFLSGCLISLTCFCHVPSKCQMSNVSSPMLWLNLILDLVNLKIKLKY